MRTDILDKISSIKEFIEENKPKSEICRFLKCKPETLDSYLKKMNIEYLGNRSRKGISHREQRTSI